MPPALPERGVQVQSRPEMFTRLGLRTIEQVIDTIKGKAVFEKGKLVSLHFKGGKILVPQEGNTKNVSYAEIGGERVELTDKAVTVGDTQVVIAGPSWADVETGSVSVEVIHIQPELDATFQELHFPSLEAFRGSASSIIVGTAFHAEMYRP